MCDQYCTEDERGRQPSGPVDVVDELVVALTNSRIYSEQHPRMQGSIDVLHQGLQALLAMNPGRSVRVGVAYGYVFFNRRPLLGASLSSGRLIDALTRFGSGGLSFLPAVTRDDLVVFVRMLNSGARDIEDYPKANRALEAQGCNAIRLLAPYCEGEESEADLADSGSGLVSSEGGSEVSDIGVDVSAHVYRRVVASMQDAMVRSCRGKAPDHDEAIGHVRAILDRLKNDAPALMKLARYEKYDAFTFGHSIRVCLIALNFAMHMTEDVRLLQRIGLAALMHDIGKAWVPFDVLHSTTKLSVRERQEMNMHPVYGGQILLSGRSPDPLAVAVAFSHHQCEGGGGYPDSIRPARPSGATMIVKIADVFEALTAVRPYKPRMSAVRAYRIMMSMDGAFEPALLRAFVHTNGLYPVGSRVCLTTGETARVVSQTDSLFEPVVVTETDPEGERLFPEDIRRFDLSRKQRREVGVQAVVLDAEM